MKSGMLISAAFHGALIVWALLLSNRPAPLEARANPGAEIDIAFQTEEELKQEEEKVPEQDKQEPEQPNPTEVSRDTSETNAEKAENTQNENSADRQSEIARMDVAPDADQNARTEADDRKLKETQEQTRPASTLTGNPGEPASQSRPAVGTSMSRSVPAPDEASQSSAPPDGAEELAAAKTGENPQARKNSEVLVDLGERMAATLPDQPDTDKPVGQQEYEALKKRVNECWQIPELVDTQNLQIVLDIRMSGNGDVVQLKKVLVNGAKSQSQMNQIVMSLSRNLRDGNCQLADILPDDGRKVFKLVRIIFEPHDF